MSSDSKKAYEEALKQAVNAQRTHASSPYNSSNESSRAELDALYKSRIPLQQPNSKRQDGLTDRRGRGHWFNAR